MAWHKYAAKQTVVDGHVFPSKKEATRYSTLKLLLRAGEITKLELQPCYVLNVNDVHVCNYIADFRYRGKRGELIVEDVKGVKTPVYKLKKKLMLAVFGVRIFET